MKLKFNRSEPGVFVSGAVHAGLLAMMLAGFAASDRFPDAEEGIPVEFFTDNQVSEITRGEQDAKEVTPDQTPRAERQSETREIKAPGEAKQDAPTPPTRPAEMPVESAAAPAMPPLRPAVDTAAEEAKAAAAAKAAAEAKAAAQAKAAAEARAAEAKAKAEAEAEAREQAEAEARQKAAAAAKAKAEADARAKAALEAKIKQAEADAKAKQELEAKIRQAEADAKAKAELDAKVKAAQAKAQAEAKAKADAEAKAQKQAELAKNFNAGDIRSLLASKAASQSTGSSAPQLNRTASLGTATGNAQRLNPSQRDALVGLIQEQLHKCWVVPVALQAAQNPPVPTVRVKLNQDGSLAAEPAVMNRSSDPLFNTAADSATRATRRCAPLRIPQQFAPFYNDWKDLVVNFNLREMG